MKNSIVRKIALLRALAIDKAATPAETQAALVKAHCLESRLENTRKARSHATLPKHLETRNHLRQMKVGQAGWMVPWGMVADLRGRLYLNAEYTFRQFGGTACLYVERRSDGYHVWTLEAEQHGCTWDRTDSTWGRDIPVREIHTQESPTVYLDKHNLKVLASNLTLNP